MPSCECYDNCSASSQPLQLIHSLIAKQRRTHAADDHVHSDTDRDEEARCKRVHPRQVRHRRRSAEDEHCADDDVGGQPEEEEDQVSDGPPARANNFEPGVCVGGIELEFGGELKEAGISQSV